MCGKAVKRVETRQNHTLVRLLHASAIRLMTTPYGQMRCLAARSMMQNDDDHVAASWDRKIGPGGKNGRIGSGTGSSSAGGRGSVMLATHATSKFSHFACCSVVIFTAQQCSRQRFRDPSTRFASFTWAGRGLSADHLWPNEIALPVVGLKSKTVGTIRKKQMHVKRAINLEDILARPMYSLQRCTEDMPWRKCCTMRVVTDRRPS